MTSLRPLESAPCFNLADTNEVLSVASTLTLGERVLDSAAVYEFTVAITVLSRFSGIKSATTKVLITTVDKKQFQSTGVGQRRRAQADDSDDFPTLMIANPPFVHATEGRYTWNSNDPFKLLGSASGSRTVLFKWTFVSGGPAAVNTKFSGKCTSSENSWCTYTYTHMYI